MLDRASELNNGTCDLKLLAKAFNYRQSQQQAKSKPVNFQPRLKE
jgi:hypothetical protein